MSNPWDFRESYFTVGDSVELLTGDYELYDPEATGDAELIGDAEGVFTVSDLEGDARDIWYDLKDTRGYVVLHVLEEDLRKAD